jgi:hypothetical protein
MGEDMGKGAFHKADSFIDEAIESVQTLGYGRRGVYGGEDLCPTLVTGSHGIPPSLLRRP